MNSDELLSGSGAHGELKKWIYLWTEEHDYLETDIPGFILVRCKSPTEPSIAIYEPCICLVAQGAKQVQLAGEEYIYDENHMLITSVGLPVMTRVLRASQEMPLLCLVLKIDLQILSQLLVDCNLPDQLTQKPGRAMAVCEVPGNLIDSFVRLISLLNVPKDIPILSPLILKEILYRLLMGDLGNHLRQVATAGSNCQRISRAVNLIRKNYANQIRVDKLAMNTGMSLSTFHHHFRALTTMTPLQFQKMLRLYEARRLMLIERQDATTAALQVGYESASQFSREYKRQFGAPPLRDIKLLYDTEKYKKQR